MRGAATVAVALSFLMLLAGCASVPSGPDVLVLPGTGKNFDEFRVDDMVCRDFALRQIGGRARAEAANQAAVGKAALGTAIGAVAGAAIGGRDGAGAGAGTGLIVGSAAGAGGTDAANYGSQRQYDMAYVQCMYAKGHRVPVDGIYGDMGPTSSGAGAAAAVPPPPPAGMPPPPPR